MVGVGHQHPQRHQHSQIHRHTQPPPTSPSPNLSLCSMIIQLLYIIYSYNTSDMILYCSDPLYCPSHTYMPSCGTQKSRIVCQFTSGIFVYCRYARLLHCPSVLMVEYSCPVQGHNTLERPVLALGGAYPDGPELHSSPLPQLLTTPIAGTLMVLATGAKKSTDPQEGDLRGKECH